MSIQNRKNAVAAVLDLLETYDIGQGEVEFKFSDGGVIRARFRYVSEQEWKQIDEKAKRGLVGTLSDWWKRNSA